MGSKTRQIMIKGVKTGTLIFRAHLAEIKETAKHYQRLNKSDKG